MEYLYIALGVLNIGALGYTFYLGSKYGENKINNEIADANREANKKVLETADTIINGTADSGIDQLIKLRQDIDK